MASRLHGAGSRPSRRIAPLTGALVGVSALVAACAASPSTSSAGSLPATGGLTATTHLPARPEPGLAAPAGSSETLLTYHYDNARDGVDTADPAFGHLVAAWWTKGTKIEGDVYAEPLIDDGLVLVATEDDDLYALDASTGAVEWKVNVGQPATTASVQGAPGLSGCGDIFPLGITGTPVIDPATGVLYLAAEVQKPGTTTWQGIEHVMVAVQLSDHKVLWERQIDPPHAGDGSGDTYIVAAEQQRPALSLSDGRVYAEFGGLSGDCSAYHGDVVSLATSGKGALDVYETPSAREDAIWATSGAAVNSAGDLFVATGNGSDTDVKFEMDDAVIELSPGLKVLSYYAPADWKALNTHDLDLGSDGPTLLGDGLLFESGKAGFDSAGERTSWGYLLRPGHLGGVGHPAYRGTVCPDAGFVFGSNATLTEPIGGKETTVVFVPCPTGTVALAVTAGAHPSFRTLWSATDGANGPPIVAGGLVWALSTGADKGGSPADELSGMDPVTGRVEVTESVPVVEHFATPAAGDGELVVGTGDGVEAFRPKA